MLITNVSQLYNNLLISSLVVLVVTGVLDGLETYKCLPERSKPINEQHDSVQCEHCQRWMRSAGAVLFTGECNIHQCDL